MRTGAIPRPVVAPPWVFIGHPTTNLVWLRCDLSVIAVGCDLCKADVNEPCFFEAVKRLSGRCVGGVMRTTVLKRPGHYRGDTHAVRRAAAAKRNEGRAKIGVPLTIEVDMDTGNLKIHALAPNLKQGRQ